MKKIVTFGEIMGRLAAPDMLRLRQALPGPLGLTFGGAEANVAVSLSILGADAAFVTALPQHAVADACVDTLRGLGIDTRHIIRTDQGRLGLYFLESGANQRPSRVIYDRDGSSVGLTPGDRYDWSAIFDGAHWFHTTGVTPAISHLAADAAIHAASAAKAAGLTVSCDLNFRKKLWRWEPGTGPRALAEKTIRRLLPMVDLVIGNEEDCADVLGIRAAETDVQAGKLQIHRYADVARQLVAQFPNVLKVAITLRESVSASHNNWGAMLYCSDDDTAHFAPTDGDTYRPYQIRNIVDRVGGGDAFAAGLIFGLSCDDFRRPSDALEFAVAASCLAHSTVGDLNYSTRTEVEALASGSSSGRVVR